MKNYAELKEIFTAHSWKQMNVHVHTHLCDGKPEMTVDNIAERAKKEGVKLIVLTPHFHKQLKDSETVLYEDTQKNIFGRLREEIETYEKKDGAVHFLLSTETDIISVDGTLSITPTAKIEEALDFIMPTLNFHPMLPLRAVGLTEPAGREKLHSSGEYAAMVEKAGGMEYIITTMYDAQVNAIQKAPCQAMLGHFFAGHSYNGPYNWFGLCKEHLPLMKDGAERVLQACSSVGAMVDITGNRMSDGNIIGKRESLGFLFEFQQWFLKRCRELEVVACPGGDAHDLSRISGTWFYEDLYEVNIR